MSGVPFQFPTSPYENQVVTGPGGIQYRWDGEKWVAVGGGGGGGDLTFPLTIAQGGTNNTSLDWQIDPVTTGWALGTAALKFDGTRVTTTDGPGGVVGTWTLGSNADSNFSIIGVGNPPWPVLAFGSARGTRANPLGLQDGNGIGAISFDGYVQQGWASSPNNTGFTAHGPVSIFALASGNWTTTSTPAELWIRTTAPGSIEPELCATVGPGRDWGFTLTGDVGSILALKPTVTDPDPNLAGQLRIDHWNVYGTDAWFGIEAIRTPIGVGGVAQWQDASWLGFSAEGWFGFGYTNADGSNGPAQIYFNLWADNQNEYVNPIMGIRARRLAGISFLPREDQPANPPSPGLEAAGWKIYGTTGWWGADAIDNDGWIGMDAHGNFETHGDVIAPNIVSEIRFKRNVGDYSRGLAAICALRPVHWEWNGFGGVHDRYRPVQYGVLADEAELVLPESIGTRMMRLGENDETVKTLDDKPILYALVNAVKELAAKVEALEKA